MNRLYFQENTGFGTKKIEIAERGPAIMSESITLLALIIYVRGTQRSYSHFKHPAMNLCLEH